MTTAMASYAATQGFNVLQIFFEDLEKQISRKHIARLTEIEAKDLSKPDNIEYVKERLNEMKKEGFIQSYNEHLKIKRFPSGEKTARALRSWIERVIKEGFRPDLVIIDYFECIESEYGSHVANEYEREGKTMRTLEAMANELGFALWVPTQGTKDSINLDIVTMDKAGGSAKKVQIGHIILSISKQLEDQDANRATIAVLKNRAGKSGNIFQNCYFNNGTCIINTDDVNNIDSMFQYEQYKDETTMDLQRDMALKIKMERDRLNGD